ncbi:MAG TPA: methyltransferase domain-containing protein [Ktedonobacterales bacterium]
MTCPGCTGGANVFGDKAARSNLKSYRKNGPAKNTRILLDALRREGVEGRTLLDIGGGVGAISMELLKSGVTSATQVDASTAYVAAANAEAAREGVSDRFAARQGDFVALAPETPAADVVTLDRVICCYPDMRALVSESAGKAARLYGVIYPRDTWWARMGGATLNAVARLFRVPLRNHIFPTAAVDAVIREQGLTRRYQHDAFYWQVVVYGRPVEGLTP